VEIPFSTLKSEDQLSSYRDKRVSLVGYWCALTKDKPEILNKTSHKEDIIIIWILDTTAKFKTNRNLELLGVLHYYEAPKGIPESVQQVPSHYFFNVKKLP